MTTDAELEKLFARLRRAESDPDAALLGRVLADAATQQAREHSWLTRWSWSLGGAITATGALLGFAIAEAISAAAALLPGAETLLSLDLLASTSETLF